MRAADIADDLTDVLVTEEQILAKLQELAAQVAKDYAGKDLVLVGVLKGAVMVMADFARALPMLVPMDWMAVSSYGAGTKSSGVVQIRKDLDTDLHDKHVLIVEDIIDSGLTLSWLLDNFRVRGAASVEVLARVPCTGVASPAAGRVVAVRQGPVLATSFHPELTGDGRVHALFVDMIQEARR